MPLSQRLLTTILRHFFHLLYHQLAFTYDLVAWVVSLGRWRGWVLALVDDIQGPAVLEIGHGPGHLLLALWHRGLRPVGLDASSQMSFLAYERLCREGVGPVLVNGYAQYMPFFAGSFDQVVATFPAEFIWEQATLHEIQRILKPHGQFLLLPIAWIGGNRPLERAARWLFQITHQAPTPGDPTAAQHLASNLARAGFHPRVKQRTLADGSTLLVITASKR